MHVDRSKFLAITATLAGCAAQPTPPPQEQPATVVSIAAVAQVDSPPPAEPVFPDEVAVDQSPEKPMANEASNDVWVASQPANHQGAPTGPAAACSQLRAPPGPHCESFQSLQEDCETIVGALEPATGQRTVNCLLAKSGTRDICDFVATPKCAEQSLSPAPVRPATASLCRSVAQRCGRSVSQATCEVFLTAVVPAHDAQLVTCLSESCSLIPCFFALP